MVTQILKNINAHSLQNLPGIPFALPGRGGVVGAQSLGGVAQTLKVVGQNPGRHQHVHTGVKQVLFVQAVLTEQWQPA